LREGQTFEEEIMPKTGKKILMPIMGIIVVFCLGLMLAGKFSFIIFLGILFLAFIFSKGE